MEAVRKNITFIINPIAGAGRGKGIEETVRCILQPGRFEVSFRYTHCPGNAVTIAEQAVSSGADILVAVGGDGTINQVASAARDTGIPLGIIPAGSGNGLAHHLKIPFRLEKALKVITGLRTASVDTGTINGRFFVSVAGTGFDAWVAEQFAARAKRGFLSYLNITLSGYRKYQPKEYMITIDGHEFQRKAMMIIFANSDQFGYKATIAPDALIDDGLFDVCVIGKPPLRKSARVAYLLFTRQIHRLEQVEILKGTNIRVIRPEAGAVNLDGESVVMDQTLDIIVHPNSLNVIIP